MCFSCNPFCGNCKPPVCLSVICDDCGRANIISRQDYLDARGLPYKGSSHRKVRIVCEKCGKDLSDSLEGRVKPKPCYRSHIICGYPCGRSVEKPKPQESACENMVPLGRLEEWSEDGR